ncbi:MAG: beta-galactosidase trimerization domain-containing protein [Daejeonella sp.]
MHKQLPLIGAEIFIEPGQTPEEIDVWFKRLHECGMKVTRIRMFENYMHLPDGNWDFTLFDHAFIAAEKYGIQIYANLFPATSFTDVGGFKFPRDQEHLDSIAEYIKECVSHFKEFSSLVGWVPLNEPGSGTLPDEPFTRQKFAEWKEAQPKETFDFQKYEHLDFAEERFLLEYETWFLKWLTEEIKKFDHEGDIHINNHQIFENVAEYNFPEWRKFLSSLGGSAHASWHFGYFSRNQYALAMSANSEILRSGAGDIPWLMTELQGGNNIYSGFEAMCPTPEEITQWLWITLATESKGSIFWCLNPRMSGFEAGEWALLNFQNEPSERMKAASDIANLINENTQLFANAKVVESGISILYTRESLWIEKKLQTGGKFYEGRNIGGVIKSAISWFEAISEMGIQANFKEISEFDFSASDYSNQTIILSHQISIPKIYHQSLKDFVSRGGKLIVDGLTAYYDENAVCMFKNFPFKDLFGSSLQEVKMTGNIFQIELSEPKLSLYAHLWKGTLSLSGAKELSLDNQEVLACKNTFGEGSVFWAPTLIGLAARLNNDYQNLYKLIAFAAGQSIKSVPIRFKNPQPGMLMKIMQSGNSYLAIIINKSEDTSMELINQFNYKTPNVLFANKGGFASKNTVQISMEETMVIQWIV